MIAGTAYSAISAKILTGNMFKTFSICLKIDCSVPQCSYSITWKQQKQNRGNREIDLAK